MRKILDLFKKNDFLILLICTAFVFLFNLISLNVFDLGNLIKNRYVTFLVFCIIIMLIFRKKKLTNKMKISSKFRFRKLKKSIRINLKNIKINPQNCISKIKTWFKNINISTNEKCIFIIWELLFIFVIISIIINKGNYLIDTIIMLIVAPIFFLIVKKYDIERHLSLACIINLFPLLFILKLGNTLGILITFIGIITINSVIRRLSKKGYILTYLIIVSMFTMLILITQCRTCLLSFLLIALINYIYILKNLDEKYKKKKVLSILVTAICVLICSVPLYNLMFHKYSNTAFDITSGRGGIWQKILTDDIALFGNRDNYFLQYVNKGDAHNVYIQALGHYGVIVLILYIILNICILFRICKKRKKLEHINFFLNYFIISIFENIFFMDTKIILVNVLLFMYIGIILKDNNNYYCFDLLKELIDSLNIKPKKKNYKIET